VSGILSRRALIGASLSASLGMRRSDSSLLGRDTSDLQGQAPSGALNVKDFGAKGDSLTDDAPAFRAGLAAAGRANGVLVVPPSSGKYVVRSPLILTPNITIHGAGGLTPTLQLADAGTLFAFTGSHEAEALNVTLAHLTLESASPGAGMALRLRNFHEIFLRHVSINRFGIGMWADWGIGVHLYGCSVIRNTRGLQVGGAGGAGGIRGGDRLADPFMDTVVVDACTFAQNGLDLNDMGSTRALGAIAIRNSSFYEDYTSPVSGKHLYIRTVNRKGITICGNWFEGGQPGRTCVYLGDHDQDGAHTGTCRGAAIFGNDFLQTGASDTIGVDVASCDGATIFGNCFEFAPSNKPVRLAGSVPINTMGQNSYVTYPDRPGYANPIAGGAP
jgi:pectate lyase-like protein